MKVAVLTYFLDFGGVETVIRELVAGFRRRSASVEILETTRRGVQRAAFERDGFEVRGIYPRAAESAFSHARRILASVSDCDVILLNDVPVGQSILSALPDSVTAISILHSCMPSMVFNAAGNYPYWDAIVCVSAATREKCLECGVPPELVYQIPNGVFVPAEYPVHSRSARLRLVYVGRLERFHKGVHRLPSVLKQALDEGIDCELFVIGDGRERESLTRTCAQLGILERLQLRGWLGRAEVAEQLQRCDVLVMTSDSEGMPLALLEGMAAGCVPVAPRLHGSTETVILSGKTGFLVEKPDDIGGYVAALRFLSNNRQLLELLSRAAWQRAGDEFSAKVMLERYEAVIHACAKRRSEIHRPGVIDRSLLGDYPHLPRMFVRPVRKAIRTWRRLVGRRQ